MEPDLQPLTFDRHGGMYWRRYTSYKFASDINVTPIVMSELTHAVMNLPLGFIRYEERYIFSAILGFAKQQNLFVSAEGRWLGGYVPATFRSYPFCLVKDPEKQASLLLAVDEGSDLIVRESVPGAKLESFFSSPTEMSDSVQSVLSFVRKVAQNQYLTQTAVNALADAGMLVPWSITSGKEIQDKQFTGLYRVDETRLKQLDDAAFLGLRKAGSLPLLWGQIFSMLMLGRLEQLAEGHTKPATPDISINF